VQTCTADPDHFGTAANPPPATPSKKDVVALSATVAQRPRRAAPWYICTGGQSPKTSPFGLVSAGPAIVQRTKVTAVRPWCRPIRDAALLEMVSRLQRWSRHDKVLVESASIFPRLCGRGWSRSGRRPGRVTPRRSPCAPAIFVAKRQSPFQHSAWETAKFAVSRMRGSRPTLEAARV
jgi:hypothetical protein